MTDDCLNVATSLFNDKIVECLAQSLATMKSELESRDIDCTHTCMRNFCDLFVTWHHHQVERFEERRNELERAARDYNRGKINELLKQFNLPFPADDDEVSLEELNRCYSMSVHRAREQFIRDNMHLLKSVSMLTAMHYCVRQWSQRQYNAWQREYKRRVHARLEEVERREVANDRAHPGMGEVLTCGICYDLKTVLKMFACCQCGFVQCLECMERGLNYSTRTLGGCPQCRLRPVMNVPVPEGTTGNTWNEFMRKKVIDENKAFLTPRSVFRGIGTGAGAAATAVSQLSVGDRVEAVHVGGDLSDVDTDSLPEVDDMEDDNDVLSQEEMRSVRRRLEL